MENNSKQAVLSIVGIAILVIAVVGVSFAFFTYSRTGTTNNVITTGKIEFAYTELNQLSLTNQFPQSVEDGKGNDTFNFTVSGTIPTTANAVNYTVTAVAGDAAVDDNGTPDDTDDDRTLTKRLKDSEINLYVTGDGTVVSGYDNGTKAAGNSATGFQIASGTIGNTGLTQTHTYSMTMWVNETVTISDTDTTKTYCASASECADSRSVYHDLYYSLKVNVSATDAIA